MSFVSQIPNLSFFSLVEDYLAIRKRAEVKVIWSLLSKSNVSIFQCVTIPFYNTQKSQTILIELKNKSAILEIGLLVFFSVYYRYQNQLIS